jgi:hypothetical protein
MKDLRPGIEAEMLEHLRSGSREMRLAAVGVLGTLPDAGGLEGLGLALADEVEEVRRAAALAIVAGREPREFLDTLLPAFGTDGASSLRVVLSVKEFAGAQTWQRFNIERYCRERIGDGVSDPALRAAAEALLRALKDSNTLLRPAGPLGAETLLRPAQGPGDSDPDTLLRADDPPPEPARPRRGPIRRLFTRQSRADDD